MARSASPPVAVPPAMLWTTTWSDRLYGILRSTSRNGQLSEWLQQHHRRLINLYPLIQFLSVVFRSIHTQGPILCRHRSSGPRRRRPCRSIHIRVPGGSGCDSWRRDRCRETRAAGICRAPSCTSGSGCCRERSSIPSRLPRDCPVHLADILYFLLAV